MSYNLLNHGGKITTANNCVHDSNIGYEVDLSNNGDVDEWLYYDGIHTYGCWNNYLFGTLYDDHVVIGRYDPFRPVEAEDYYFVKIVMKLVLKERVSSRAYPSNGRIMWRTLSDPIWSDNKQYDFELYNDEEWHTYYLNMGEVQWWQGDINDLRIYPILENGIAGDDFYIRTIEILSVNTYKCLNYSCSYFSQYEHNCPGIGERGYCKSKDLDALVREGTRFEFAGDILYTIEEGVNDILYVNINEYGFENIILSPMQNVSGKSLVIALTKEISKLDVGGYAECDVDYTDRGAIIIYAGNYVDDSTVRINDSQLARELQFRDYYGNDVSVKHVGRNPATGFRPLSSFKIKTHQIYGLLDTSTGSDFYFNPFIPSVEGGRRDWLATGLGEPSKDVRGSSTDDSGILSRSYDYVENNNKTIIDFNHPFNASGRITKIYAGVTLDNVGGSFQNRGTFDLKRIVHQMSDAKIMFFRPLKNGNFRVLPMEIPINNRDRDLGNIYSATQEYVELDCDVFINKGDLIGVYNANVYRSKSISGSEIDALYYQVTGKAAGNISVRQPHGNGQSGLLLYARGDFQQNRLVLDIDLGKRVNIKNIYTKGVAVEERLEYNIARCLDVNWSVDLFDEDHTTGYIHITDPLILRYFNHPNIYYGKECLTDGIKTVPDGLAADGFSIIGGNHYNSLSGAMHKKDGGTNVILSGPKYFSVNGDCEWVGVYLHAGKISPFSGRDFSSDPIALTLHFPYQVEKLMHKSRIYFKERFNFRSFAVSHYRGEFYTNGTADDVRYDLLPCRSQSDLPEGVEPTPWQQISLDGLVYSPEFLERWDKLNLYLAQNPSIGHSITESTGVLENNYDSDFAYWDKEGGLQYYETGIIINNKQFEQATRLDWTIIEHEWTPIRTKGYRLYCDFHESTKICEFEIFCFVENIRSSMEGTVNIDYSAYEENWWTGQNFTEIDGIRTFIGDTPQYARITITPITEIKFSDIVLEVSYEDVYMGEKGCQHMVLPVDVQRGKTSISQKIDFKNIYGLPYDLYVDVESNSIVNDGVIFYSILNNEESIDNPVIGPDAYYRKHSDYRIANDNKNVAINCPVYALKNLLDGADAWYSHDREYSWKYWGKITEGNNLNFSNLPNSAITTINVPVFTRSKWWKIGFFDPRIVMTVREVHVFYRDEEIPDVTFYHHKNQNVITGANTDIAPHLQDGIVDGSYYILKGDNYIGFELPEVQEVDRIVLYHDFKNDYENSHDIAGIDVDTSLCIHGEGDHYQTDSIVDESYYEHTIQVVGSGIYTDERYTDIYYDFTQDFSDCVNTVELFDGPDIDTSRWTDLVGASIESGELNITNSGVVGEVTTVPYYYGDFDVTVDLSIDGEFEDNPGWGCCLEARTDDNRYIRVERSYMFLHGQGVFGYVNSLLGTDLMGYAQTDVEVGIQLRLCRTDEGTSAYAIVDGFQHFLGDTTVLGTDAIKFRLLSNLSPLAMSVTVGKFDNFTIDNSDADWGVNPDYSSSFTCTSGLPTSVSGGWGYYYNVGTGNFASGAGYKIPRINEVQAYPMDQDFEFTFKFMFQGESFMDYLDNSSDSYGVSVGLLGYKVQWPSGKRRLKPYFTGVQVVLRRDNIGIATQNTYCQSSSSYTALNTGGCPYYCKFTGNGEGQYVLAVWTDNYDGVDIVATTTLNTTLTWEADKVGVGSGYYKDYYFDRVGRCKGWVADFDFTCHKKSLHQKFGSAIKFSNFPGEHLCVKYENSSLCNITKEGFAFDTKRFTIDFHIKFNSLPTVTGDYVWLIGSWHKDQLLSGIVFPLTPSSWILYLQKVSSGYKLKFKVNCDEYVTSIFDKSWSPDLHRWYHIMLVRGPSSLTNVDYCVMIKDGHGISWHDDTWGDNISWSGTDVTIGKGLDGWLEEIRVSADYEKGGGRVDSLGSYYEYHLKTVPTKRYERYYTISLYDSSDNVYYGKNMDVDVMFDNTYSYHELFSTWSESYYTVFAVDFGQRHYLDIVRSFPVDSSYQFTKTSNILYSNKDTVDPVEAFSLTEEEQELSTGFNGQNHNYPHNFISYDTTKATSYIIDDTFYQMVNPNVGQEYARADFKPYFKGNFDVQIDFDLGADSPSGGGTWQLQLQFEVIDNSNFAVMVERSFRDNSDQYAFWVKDNNSSWAKKSIAYYQHQRGSLRLIRENQIFKAYYKEKNATKWSDLGFWQMRNTFNPETTLKLYTISDAPLYPKIENWWDNFIVNFGEPLYSTYTDTRWAKIKMLNGDGVSRIIKNAGFYPSIYEQNNEIGQYNCIWESLGTAITSYAGDDNLALGVTCSGSSYVGVMTPDKAVNGVTTEGDFSQCWGSEEESTPWITLHLTELEQIYRIRIHHGYEDKNTLNIIFDYKVQVSTDNETFTTIFNIESNTMSIRTHDLIYPVWAKQIRIYVTNYRAINRYVWTGEERGFQFWKGAILREIEVYKYYGFTVINSEDTPVIAIDLKQQFFIEGHSLIGIDAHQNGDGSYSACWSNNSSNFTYCNSDLSDPKKVEFRPWGSTPKYDKWVAIKRNTASKYPETSPDIPDYLKHVIIKGAEDEDGTAPNPFEYPWFWESTVSQLSYDYSMLASNPSGGFGHSLSRSLKIEYPATTEAEHIYFIEGDVFGKDEVCSCRDGFGFHIWIDDINNIDYDFGYIYFGGFDYTTERNSVVHSWNWSTISGTLQNGWNNLNLTFLYADEISYTELSNTYGDDSRRLWTIDWGKIGLVFRGKGNPITMCIDGSYIERNHFEHGCFQDYGLYLHANDIMKIQVGAMDFHSGTIEFFIRPDWDWDGRDAYGEFKYRTLFHLGNVANDMLGAAIGPRGIEVYYGNLLSDLHMFGVTGMNTKVIDTVTHLAFVFSNDGSGIASDNSTIRVYINNYLVAKETKPWKVSDDKHFNFIFGGQGVLVVKSKGYSPVSSAVDGVLSRLRIHNYCKTDFSDSLGNSESLNDRYLDDPSQFVEISKDNVTFHKVGSVELPFFYEEVSNGESIPVWVRFNLPKHLSGVEKRTAKILGNWDIGV